MSLPYTGFGTGFFDADLDGDLDLIAVNGKVGYENAAEQQSARVPARNGRRGGAGPHHASGVPGLAMVNPTLFLRTRARVSS